MGEFFLQNSLSFYIGKEKTKGKPGGCLRFGKRNGVFLQLEINSGCHVLSTHTLLFGEEVGQSLGGSLDSLVLEQSNN